MADKKFLLFWLGDDTVQVVNGRNISSAMNNAGIGAGALPALDFHSELKRCPMGGEFEFVSARKYPKSADNLLTVDSRGNPVHAVERWKNAHGTVEVIR